MTVAGQDRAGDDHFLDLVGTLEDAVSLDVAEALLNAAFLHVALAAVERVRRHIADAGGGKLMPRNAQRNGAVCGGAAL